MKKILLILILLFISVNVFAQKIQFADTSGGKTVLREVSWRYPLPVKILNFSNLLDTNNIAYLNKDNVFTGTNIFPKAYIDSLVIRIYALDTGTNITRTILPQTTRLYNFGSSDYRWLNSYTQNSYIDTVKTDIVFSRDVKIDSTVTARKVDADTINATGDIKINGNSVRPYKVYTALLTQSDTLAPVATVLENTIGDIVWSREDVGIYKATLVNAFTSNKVFVKCNTVFYTGQPAVIELFFNIDYISITDTATTYDMKDWAGATINNQFPIEIRVYY